MAFISLIPQPIRLGSPDAEPTPSSGNAQVVYGCTEPLQYGGLTLTPEAAPGSVEGLPDSGDIIVPAVVAAAMATLGIRHNGVVISPGRIVGIGTPAAHAPNPVLHLGVSTLW